MAHLIDKDALVAWAKETYLCENASMIRKVCYKQFMEHLETLQVKEVDLEKEIEQYVSNKGLRDYGFLIPSIAKHFFELGLKAQRKSVSIQNIDDVLKEIGVDPYSKEAKMIKESYYAAMDKLLAQKGE